MIHLSTFKDIIPASAGQAISVWVGSLPEEWLRQATNPGQGRLFFRQASSRIFYEAGCGDKVSHLEKSSSFDIGLYNYGDNYPTPRDHHEICGLDNPSLDILWCLGVGIGTGGSMKLAYREMSLLLVDQISTALDTLQDYLRELEFYRVWTAKGLEEALEVLRDRPVNLVISAWKMKPYNGLQLLERIRKDPKFSDLPFLIMLDRREKHLAEKMQQMGSVGIINLPLEGKDVRAQVEKGLEPFIDPNEEIYRQAMARARKAVRLNKDSEAEDAFRAALAVVDHEDANLGLARLLAKKEEYPEAEATYFKVLRANPLSLRAYLGLAELYSQQDRLTEALKVLAAAVKATTKIKQAGTSRASIFYYMGELELRLKRLKEAMGYFELAAQEEPENKDLQAQIGDSLVRAGHLAESEAYYERALEIDPRMAHVYNRLGMAYRRQSKFQKAVDLFYKAQAFHPEDENLYYNLARCLWEMKDHQKAADKLGTALQLNPEFTEAQQLLNVVLSEMGYKVQDGDAPPQPPKE